MQIAWLQLQVDSFICSNAPSAVLFCITWTMTLTKHNKLSTICLKPEVFVKFISKPD